jgi:drug/metabolite transporter (DMT)-like permease
VTPPVLSARERRIGYACAFAVLFVWAGFLLMSRAGARGPFTAWDLGLLRYGGSFLAVLPIIWLRGLPRIGWRPAAACVATAGFGFPLFAYAGFGFAPAAHGGVMLPGLLPFWAALVMWLVLGDRFTRIQAIALALVAGGIALLASDTFGAHPGAWRGDLLLACGSFCWAWYMLAVRVFRVPATDATFAIALYALPAYLPVWWLFLPSRLDHAPWDAILAQAAFQGVIAVIVAGFLFTRAMNALGSARLTTITACVPALAALGAWPLLDEPLGIAGLAGVALVTAAMLVGVLGRR